VANRIVIEFHVCISDYIVPGGFDRDDARRGQDDEHGFGFPGFADGVPHQHDTAADQNLGEAGPGGSEGAEKGVSEQQVDHLQRWIAGRFLPTKVPQLRPVDHVPGGRLVLLRPEELQVQVVADTASDDVDPVARHTRR